jgi:hypothetical protein
MLLVGPPASLRYTVSAPASDALANLTTCNDTGVVDPISYLVCTLRGSRRANAWFGQTLRGSVAGKKEVRQLCAPKSACWPEALFATRTLKQLELLSYTDHGIGQARQAGGGAPA